MSDRIEHSHVFLAGGGQMGARVRAFDWAATPLGAPETWPEALRTMVSVVLNSKLLGTLLWGPELRLLYNDAYAPALAERHPGALGQPIAEVWGPVWNQLAPAFLRVMATGEPIFETRYALPMMRNGGEELTYWNYSVAPIRDGEGLIVGLLNQAIEITGEVQAEGRQAEMEMRLRRAQEAGGVGLFTVDTATDVIQPTAEFCRLYGLPVRGSYPASAIERLITPEDRHLVSTATSRAEGRLIRDVEYRIRRPDTGEVRWIARRGDIETDASGQVSRFSGTARDITERKLAQDAVERSDRRFRTIVETIDAAFAIVQVKFDAADRPVDYLFVEANPAFERQAGVNLRGKWVTEFAPDLEQFWFDTYGHVARTGEPANFESYAEAFQRWFDVRAVRVGDPDERQIAILFSDVTERRKADERLRASEALARENVERVQLALAAGAIIGTWNWDLPTDRFTVDEAFALSFGLDPALGHEGIPLTQIVATVHPDDRAGLAKAISEVIGRGGPYAHQYRVRRADGRYHWLEANGRVDHASDGTPLSFPGVLIDIENERALIEERDRAAAELRALNENLEHRIAERTVELMRAEEALRQSQKMEAVGQLTGGLAHDFNNLLTGVTGALDLIERRVGQGRYKDIERYTTIAQGAAKRAAALTHRLLAFSRRQTLDPKPTDPNRLVAEMEELIRRTVGPAVHVEAVKAGGLWPTLVDPNQLENALLNLCINARDAMPDGGRLTIETANRWLDERTGRERDLPPGQYVSLCVSDTGTGMPPDVVAKAFDPFFTTKPLGQGTGLGLSMIYGFARQSGGQARIYSEPGEGTMVCLYLPRHLGPSEAPQFAPEMDVAPSTEAGETVLVVDDEPSVRLLVEEILSELGYAVIEAGDGPSGLRVLQSDARIDLLVTDVGLPGGMNGRQVADAARALRPELPVLFITGYAENALVGNGQLDAGMHVLTKPFAMEALASRVKAIVSGAV